MRAEFQIAGGDPMPTPEKSSSLPQRVIVSLQLGGIFFAIANVVCVSILAYAYLSVKQEPKTLEVKGSAKKTIVSDTITWNGTISSRDPDLIKAYDKIKADADRVAEFIRKAGIADTQVTIGPITTNKIFQREVVPPVSGQDKPHTPTIIQTNKIEMYELTQWISIESQDMEKVSTISRTVTSLIKDGVEIDSQSPNYTYSKLSDLKIDMLAEATRDATARATQIVSNANGTLGRLVEAKMGVMQINPKGVTDVSDSGTVRFELR
jgi:hypothetical protein